MPKILPTTTTQRQIPRRQLMNHKRHSIRLPMVTIHGARWVRNSMKHINKRNILFFETFICVSYWNCCSKNVQLQMRRAMISRMKGTQLWDAVSLTNAIRYPLVLRIMKSPMQLVQSLKFTYVCLVSTNDTSVSLPQIS